MLENPWDNIERIALIMALLGALFTIIKFIILPYREIAKLKRENEDLVEKNRELVSGEIGNILNLATDDIITNVEEVKSKLYEVMKSSEKDIIRVDNFGLDLETVQAMFRYNLNEISLEKEVIYRVLAISPTSEAVSKLCNANGNICQDTSSRAIEFVKNQIDKNEVQFSIELISYESLPVIHGFLVNDEYLFLGFTRIEKRGLKGGDAPYIFIKSDKNNPFKCSLFKTYRTWFDYIAQTGKVEAKT